MSTLLNSRLFQVVYFVTIVTAVTHHRQTTVSLIVLKFSDFPLTNAKFRLFQVFQATFLALIKPSGTYHLKRLECWSRPVQCFGFHLTKPDFEVWSEVFSSQLQHSNISTAIQLSNTSTIQNIGYICIYHPDQLNLGAMVEYWTILSYVAGSNLAWV